MEIVTQTQVGQGETPLVSLQQNATYCEFSGRLWLIGGTQESVELATAIAHANLPCTISVTTEPARSLYPIAPTLRVWVGRLNPAQLKEFLQQQIVAVLDASHPFAVEISRQAIAATEEMQIPYLRYERPMLEQGRLGVPTKWGLGDSGSPLGIGVRGGERGAEEQGSRLDSFETLLSGSYLQGQRVMLTVGYRPLPLFQPWQECSTLFARILPTAIAIDAAFKAGFTPERLICLRPPICAALEKALWQQWEISLVVTKASGTAGGEDIKRTVAAELGIPIIVINRPAIQYPQQTSDLSAALEFCHHQLNCYSAATK